MDKTRHFRANCSSYASSRPAHTPHRPPLSYLEPDLRASLIVPQHQSPYFTPSGFAQNTLYEPPSPVLERPLDDFDRELLRESQGLPKLPQPSGLAQVTASLKPFTPPMNSSTKRFLQDDLHDNPMLPSISSSPTVTVSSPTVSVLHNRQRTRASLPHHDNLPVLTPETQPRIEQRPLEDKDAKPGPAQTKGSLKSLPVIHGIPLVPATALPDQLRAVFKFEIFNAVQSKCFPTAFKSDDNLVISAPTGSGKTAVMELAICRLVADCKNQDFKVVYQAPTKSLCAERFQDWQKKFSILNLRCAELTGDTELGHLRDVQKASIIITTPEKWDSVTRKWKDHAKLMQLVRLFLVDEVHILKDERGATLEAVVSRMKSVVPKIRFVALSATVPNSEDIAAWLGMNSTTQHLPARMEVFRESFRPVQLKKHVLGFEFRGNDFAFESMLTQQIPDIIAKHGRGKPVMVFCSTRNSTAITAKMLAGMWTNSHPTQRLWKSAETQFSLTNAELKATAITGVAFHHGGLGLEDRRTIEHAFLNGQINIMCSTSTLAVGVNLPCYLVILKGTSGWSDNGFKEYADLEVMQMLGRAGRPQFETSACAVILTRKDKVARYEKMMSGEELLESCLHQNLIEHLNAEIVLGTVYDVSTARRWLASTFLYVRVKKNPSHYRFREGVEKATDDELLEQLCRKDIDLLVDAGIVKEEGRLQSTIFGEAMARYCVTFDTMKSFLALPPKAKMSEILSLLVQAKDFRDVRMHAGEKSFYKEINKAPEIKFDIKVDVALTAHKISLIIQAELGHVTLPDSGDYKKKHQQYRVDRGSVFAHANRLIRCLIDCQVQLADAMSTRHALELGRSIAAHVWDNTAGQLRQVDGLGEVAVRKLAAGSIPSIDALLNTEPSRIELILGKNPPFGHQLLRKLESFPNLRVSVKETGRDIRVGKGATIRAIAEVGFLNQVTPQIFNKKRFHICFLAEDSHGSLIEFRRFGPKQLEAGEQVYFSLDLTKPTTHVNCHVLCDDVAGTSRYATLDLSGIPDSVYPPPQQQSVANNDKEIQAVENHTSWRSDEDFDDDGIDDNDLLAIDASESPVEVVEDIDLILEMEDREKVKQLKPDQDDDLGTSKSREPTQLPNGRWTCQHDCHTQGKTCKHKCCKEGVAKPKRKPKAECKIKDDPSQKKITEMDSVQAASKFAQTGQVNTVQAAEPKVSKPGKGQSKVNLREKRSRSVEKHPRTMLALSGQATSIRDSRSAEPVAKRLKRPKAPDPDFWGDEPDLDLESDHSPVRTRQASTGKHDSPRAPKKEDLFEVFDEDNTFDCSFGNIETFHGPHHVAEGTTLNFEDAGLELPPLSGQKEWTRSDEDTFDFLTSDVDLGGFDPPLEHVAMSDVLKKARSPSDDQSGTALQDQGHWPLKMADKENSICASTESGGHIVSREQRPVDRFNTPERKIDSSLGTPADSMVKTLEGIESGTARYGHYDANLGEQGMVLGHQADLKRDEKLREEDQKKKWEGIDPWIYDEFHEYIELV